MEVNKTDGDKVEIEDQKEDADYDDEEDDNDDDDDDDEEEEDDDGDEDDDEEDDGEDDNDGDEGDKENKRKFFLQDLKLFDCSNCHKRLFNTVYMCENEHIACHSCCSSSSSKCKSCAPSASFKRCQILEKIIQSLGGSCKYLKYGPCSCPIEGCNYYGPLMQLSMHLSGQHRDSITCFRYNKLYSITLRYDERFCVLQEMSDGDIFLVDNVEHDIGNMVSVSRIGPYTFISPFSIELKIEAVKWVHWDQLSLRLSCKIESIRSRVGYQPSTRDFLLVPSGYFEGGEEFELLFRISRADV